LPPLLRGAPTDPATGLVLFPVMVLGVGLLGITLTALVDGQAGLQGLGTRLRHWRVGLRWYAPLLLPPALILLVLAGLCAAIGPVFTPNWFGIGVVIGLVAGVCEELGWTGFALPRLLARFRALPAGLLLGVGWGLWHLPVVDYLGAASPHGTSWLPFALAFVALLTAL